jgi:hypothetical protein
MTVVRPEPLVAGEGISFVEWKKQYVLASSSQTSLCRIYQKQSASQKQTLYTLHPEPDDASHLAWTVVVRRMLLCLRLLRPKTKHQAPTTYTAVLSGSETAWMMRSAPILLAFRPPRYEPQPIITDRSRPPSRNDTARLFESSTITTRTSLNCKERFDGHIYHIIGES